MDLYSVGGSFEGLTRRARLFIGVHCVRVDVAGLDKYRERWLQLGIPEPEIDRAMAYQERWGGLVLPPSPEYEGGPKFLSADTPEGSGDEGWWFEAGPQRCSVPYAFMIGPTGEFGIHADSWMPLHAGIGGWIESLALARHASLWARQITKLTGDEVDGINLEGYEPVLEVKGLADTWWRGADSLVAVYTGEADCLTAPGCRAAYIYSGLDEWGLRGG